jgi:hypothetical protein
MRKSLAAALSEAQGVFLPMYGNSRVGDSRHIISQ